MSYGRRKIYTNEETIMLANIRDVLKKAYNEHQMNRNAITKLWDYYRGKTAILQKTKEVRESINHKVCENRAFSSLSRCSGRHKRHFKRNPTAVEQVFETEYFCHLDKKKKPSNESFKTKK